MSTSLPGSCSDWQPGFTAEVRHAGPELYVGIWRCAGEARPWAREDARYLQLDLQQHGVHLRAVGRERRVMDPTTCAWHLAGDEYRLHTPGSAPQRTTSLLVRGELAAGFSVRGFRHVDAGAALVHARLLASREAVEIEELALDLLARLAGREPPRVDVTPAHRRLAEAMQRVIAERHAERLTLAVIAAACGASAFHASRVFRRVTGQTVHRQLNRVRVRAALLQLRDGQLSEVGLAAGFSSHSHFSQAFRAELGVSPSAFLAATSPC